MSHSNEADETPDFKWGEKGVMAGKTQSYKSFTYDGLEYSLYDCVTLYTDDDPEPYIGKLVKLLENVKTGRKKAKVVWFFRPSDITMYLGNDDLPKNEIFLACGVGEGLCNFNDLEVINGKCNVVCISKDERNRQPSHEEVNKADYVFHRTFDVKKLQISDEFDDEIAGTEVRHFFNKKKGKHLTDVLKLEATPTDDRKSSSLSRPHSMKAIGSDGKDIKASYSPGSEGKEVKKVSDKGRDCKHLRIDDTAVSPNKDLTKADELFNSRAENKGRLNSPRDLEHLAVPIKKDVCSSDSAKHSKKLKVSLLAPERKYNVNVLQKLGSSSGDYMGKGNGTDVRSLQSKRKVVEDVYGRNTKRLEIGEKATKRYDSVGHELTQERGIKTDSWEVKVAQKAVDKSKWFKESPWEDKLQVACRNKTLVLFDNLDPSYASDEVKDIVKQAFQVDCSVKVIPRNAFSSPYSGQAFAIFKSKEVADTVINKLHDGCLMLENGRPLVACSGTPTLEIQTKFLGHLSIDKVRRQGSEMSRAVSTSHFPQPNTIEYNMAVDWIKQQIQSELHFNTLHEQHFKELNDVMKRAGSEKVNTTFTGKHPPKPIGNNVPHCFTEKMERTTHFKAVLD